MKIIILSFLVCLSFSCKHKPDSDFIDNGIEQETTKGAEEDTATVNVVPENTEDFSVKFKSLEIKQFGKKFFKDFILNSHDDGEKDDKFYQDIERDFEIVGDKTFFCTTLVIQNNTPNKITSFKLTYFLKAIYADGKTEYWPYGDKTSEENMLDDDYSNGFYSVKQKDIWSPNEIREYYISSYEGGIFNVPGRSISKKAFERTPTNFTLMIKYKGISVDGEYTQIFSYDILDSWKEYQTKLGLR